MIGSPPVVRDSRRRHHTGRSVAVVRAGLLLAACIGLTTPTAQAVGAPRFTGPTPPLPPSSVYFAEPGTGRKVQRYRIDLPLRNAPNRRFRIPCQCADIAAQLDFDQAARDTVVGRSAWRKADADCRYFVFIRRHSLPPLEDYVSSYDFANARLDDLPVDPRCGDDTTPCDRFQTDQRGMLRYFPLIDHAGPGDRDTQTTQPCQLQDGVFQGQVLIDDDGLVCHTEPNRHGLRLIGVDFADVNHDRVLDAVMRFMPLVRGGGRRVLTLPMTRFSEDVPFVVPLKAIDEGAH